jgi:hypothetical protein
MRRGVNQAGARFACIADIAASAMAAMTHGDSPIEG